MKPGQISLAASVSRAVAVVWFLGWMTSASAGLFDDEEAFAKNRRAEFNYR